MNACASGVLLILLLLVLADDLTVEAVMLAFLARTYLALPLLVIVVQRSTRADVVRSLKDLLPLVAATMLMAGAVGIVQWTSAPDAEPLWRLALSILAGVPAYAVAVLLGARPLLQRTWQLIGARH